jgi:hypothetical protein
VIFGSSCIQPMDTERAPIKRVWVPDKVEALSEPERHSITSAPAQGTANNGPSGRAISQAVSRRLPAAVARVRTWV